MSEPFDPATLLGVGPTPPGRAGTDSGHPLGVPLAAALGAPGPAGTGYTVDPDHAPQVIANLRMAAELLDGQLRSRAAELAQLVPPGLDNVSEVTTTVFHDAAVGSTGLRAALEATAAEFDRHADKLQADLAAYLQVEDANIAIPRAQPLDFWRKA